MVAQPPQYEGSGTEHLYPRVVTSVEFDELDLLERLAADLEPGTFIDVGASIGRFSQRFSNLNWYVIAFEPVPEIAAEFRTVLSNPMVKIYEAAVSDLEEETTTMYLSTDHWGIHSLAPFHSTHRTPIEVAICRLDDVINDQPTLQPIFLKIDVEGADLPALRTWPFDSHLPKVVVVEFMDSRTVPHFGYSSEDTVTYMAEYGYVGYASEWSVHGSYATRGQRLDTLAAHIAVTPLPLSHTPVWGNFIFIQPADKSWFEDVLQGYETDLSVRQAKLLRESDQARSLASNLQESLNNRERRIDALLAKDRRQSERIRELEVAIRRRDDRMSELDAAIIQRDARIAELDAAIIQRDTRISGLRDRLSNEMKSSPVGGEGGNPS